MERAWKPNVEISPNCPRCGSSNTKFCYYNNYSLTQPRYFCKGCRRYWTKGGSLRNVPVGGGCRKNRRGKSVRLSIDHGVSSKSLPYGGASSASIGHSYCNKVSSLLESTSSPTMQDGPNIDLALVYANFLNQRPDTKTGSALEMPDFPSEFDPLVDFSNVSNTNLDTGRVQLPEENDVFGSTSMPDLSMEAHLSDNSEQIYYSVFDSVHKQQQGVQLCSRNQELPPLPNEEMGSQEILWLNNSQMMVNHTLRATQDPMLGPDQAQDPNLLFGNWSPFDFPTDR
ncbi:hypothetical protein ACOSQ3_029308 [Xanthoceras sorbifolium]